MDFLDPRKKKAHKIQLYLGYVLVGIAILLTGVILLYTAFGYGIDRQGNVVQNSLVFVASTPEAAEVRYTNTATNQTHSAITNDRLTLPAGEYAFEFLKEGYRPWQHNFTISGGEVERLTYPFLFPDKLQPADIKLYSKVPAFISTSPDRNTLVVARGGNLASWDVYDTSELDQAPATIEIPESIFKPTPNSKLKLIEWSTNNRHVLVKHSHQEANEYILVDTEEPAQSINVNNLFDTQPKKVTLFDKSSERLHILKQNNQLHLAVIETAQTELVLSNVLAYKSHGDNRLLYISANNAGAKNVSVFIRGDNESYKVRELPHNSRYLLDMAQHQDRWFIVVAAESTNQVFIYRDAFETLRENNEARVLLTRTLEIKKPQKISFSDNTQYIAVQHNESFAVYDVYEDQKHYFSFDTPFDTGSGPAQWMDGHRLTGISKGKVIVFDFDGSNYQVLNSANSRLEPMFDRDYTTMVTIGPSVNAKSQAALLATPLRIEE